MTTYAHFFRAAWKVKEFLRTGVFPLHKHTYVARSWLTFGCSSEEIVSSICCTMQGLLWYILCFAFCFPAEAYKRRPKMEQLKNIWPVLMSCARPDLRVPHPRWMRVKWGQDGYLQISIWLSPKLRQTKLCGQTFDHDHIRTQVERHPRAWGMWVRSCQKTWFTFPWNKTGRNVPEIWCI